MIGDAVDARRTEVTLEGKARAWPPLSGKVGDEFSGRPRHPGGMTSTMPDGVNDNLGICDFVENKDTGRVVCSDGE